MEVPYHPITMQQSEAHLHLLTILATLQARLPTSHLLIYSFGLSAFARY